MAKDLQSKQSRQPGDDTTPDARQPLDWMTKWVGILLPALVFILSSLLTYELWRDARNNAELALQSNFEFQTRETMRRIEQRMLAYEQVLRGVVALFASSDEVNRNEFSNYVSRLQIELSYPGIQGIGFAELVPAKRRPAHVDAIRKEGFPKYDIQPHVEGRDMHAPIIYIEPFYGDNLRAFGYDMYSEPQRRAAMDLARDSGKAAVSGKVTLVQEGGATGRSGFLMYLPVYRNGVSIETIRERREALVGWVYAPFRTDDLMVGLQDEQARDLDLEIYDGSAIAQEQRMYDAILDIDANAPNGNLNSIGILDIGQHMWTVAMTSTPGFVQRFDQDRSPLIIRGGLSIALLLTLLTWLLLDDRARSLQSAEQAMRLALYDTMTGLPNRKLVSERLGRSLIDARRSKTRVGLMFLDLDRFKPVNDDFGHAVGDLLLREVANRLQHCKRESDTAARLGGDEFVVLLPRVDNDEGALVVAHKILQALAQPFDIAGHTFYISASIGVAFYPDHGTDEKTLMKNADAAMYDAKKNGRNGVSVYRADSAAG
jgi:diguanylate cyclase (GGDEF)-like protein